MSSSTRQESPEIKPLDHEHHESRDVAFHSYGRLSQLVLGAQSVLDAQQTPHHVRIEDPLTKPVSFKNILASSTNSSHARGSPEHENEITANLHHFTDCNGILFAIGHTHHEAKQPSDFNFLFHHDQFFAAWKDSNEVDRFGTIRIHPLFRCYLYMKGVVFKAQNPGTTMDYVWEAAVKEYWEVLHGKITSWLPESFEKCSEELKHCHDLQFFYEYPFPKYQKPLREDCSDGTVKRIPRDRWMPHLCAILAFFQTYIDWWKGADDKLLDLVRHMFLSPGDMPERQQRRRDGISELEFTLNRLTRVSATSWFSGHRKIIHEILKL